MFVTQLPLDTNRVDLDPDVKDEWGLPAMRITSQSHPDDIKNMEFFRQKSARDSPGGGRDEGVGRSGERQRAAARTTAAPAGWGTIRRPRSSNKYHRAHDVPNLFIVDGSNLVTGGRNHPTMTIQALAFRAADRIVKAAKNGTLSQL